MKQSARSSRHGVRHGCCCWFRDPRVLLRGRGTQQGTRQCNQHQATYCTSSTSSALWCEAGSATEAIAGMRWGPATVHATSGTDVLHCGRRMLGTRSASILCMVAHRVLASPPDVHDAKPRAPNRPHSPCIPCWFSDRHTPALHHHRL
jgi:hypothetical protein